MGEGEVCPFLLLENPRLLSPWGPLDFLSTYLGTDSLIFCRPLLFLPSVFLSIRIFSNELALCIRWRKYWSFSFSICPSNAYSGLISFRIDWSLQPKGLSRVFSNTTVQKHQSFGTQPSLWSNSHHKLINI